MDLRMADARLQVKQIFEQPNARDTVNCRYAECDTSDLIVRKIHQSLQNGGRIQMAVLIFARSRLDAHAGIFGKLVEIGQPVLRQYLEHRLASAATERVLVAREHAGSARRAAVKTVLHVGSCTRVFRANPGRHVGAFSHVPLTVRYTINSAFAPGFTFFGILLPKLALSPRLRACWSRSVMRYMPP